MRKVGIMGEMRNFSLGTDNDFTFNAFPEASKTIPLHIIPLFKSCRFPTTPLGYDMKVTRIGTNTYKVVPIIYYGKPKVYPINKNNGNISDTVFVIDNIVKGIKLKLIQKITTVSKHSAWVYNYSSDRVPDSERNRTETKPSSDTSTRKLVGQGTAGTAGKILFDNNLPFKGGSLRINTSSIYAPCRNFEIHVSYEGTLSEADVKKMCTLEVFTIEKE